MPGSTDPDWQLCTTVHQLDRASSEVPPLRLTHL